MSTDFESSSAFPQLIDPWQAAGHRAVFSGTIDLGRLQRVRDKIAEETQPAADADDTLGVSFSAEFDRDAHARPLICLRIQAVVPLQCQRSLEIYHHELVSDSQVVIVRDEAEAERVDDALEPFLLAEKQLSLCQLVEEELLLALPLVPLKPGTAAPVDARPPPDTTPRQRPFADLAQRLKGEGHDTE